MVIEKFTSELLNWYFCQRIMLSHMSQVMSSLYRVTEERPGWCTDPHLPPYAAWGEIVAVYVIFFDQISFFMFNLMCRFVEIMPTVFSRNAWRCVWHMIHVKWHYILTHLFAWSNMLMSYFIQNDLVHGWGLDFALRRCVEAFFAISIHGSLSHQCFALSKN
jgi:hypothetical protein